MLTLFRHSIKPCLPDGIFEYQTSQLWYLFEGLGIKNFVDFCGHLVYFGGHFGISYQKNQATRSPLMFGAMPPLFLLLRIIFQPWPDSISRPMCSQAETKPLDPLPGQTRTLNHVFI
jgi:hypothetical protein